MTTKYKKNTKTVGYISTYPLPSIEELKSIYINYYDNAKETSYELSYNQTELQYKSLRCDVLIHALESVLQNSSHSFIDIGAGEGFLLNAAHKKNFNVTSLDFSSGGIAKFFPHLLEYHISGDIYQNIDKLAQEKNQFSMCVSTNVLEHVLDPKLFLSSIKKVIAPGGIMAISVPNDFSDIQKFALKKGMVDNEFWFSPPRHLNYFNTSTLSEYMKKNGFEVLDAFSDFPIDLYLLHKGSNYIKNSENGPDANKARMEFDLLIYKNRGMDAYLNYYRSMFNVGMGRNITVIVRPTSS
jgi:2-polyprenyl-3-methyl-5-hydroxy-6-metoxy-1,4-benzoquinol methylase